jgi:hypothetical protein
MAAGMADSWAVMWAAQKAPRSVHQSAAVTAVMKGQFLAAPKASLKVEHWME